jgi:hypothetical protein
VKGATYTIARSTPPRMDATGKPVPAPPPRESHTVDAGKELYALEADDFTSAALEGKPPRLTRQDSIGNMRVLDQMRRQIGLPF